jgi:penicillin-binding protein 2
MSLEPHIFFDEVNERQGVFHRRTFLLGGFAGLGLLALTGRLAALQLVEGRRYQSLSASNQFNFRLRTPPRGRVLDRNGIEIASNRPDFRLLVLRDEIGDVDATLDKVSELIPITPERRKQLKRDIANSPRFVPVAIANDLTWDEFSRINVRTPELPGVTAEMGEARVYPFGGAFAHVIGYVSKINADDLAKAGPNPEPLLLHPGFRIGKQGIERSLDLQLRGKPGAQKVEVDAVGRVVREDPAGDIKATPGDDVVLTLDADIQNRALEVFGEESGGAVVMDVRNGDILCLLSSPSFDANSFVKGVSGPEYRALAGYERKPLLDKALAGLYAPGSTFKTMVALAALESGINPNLTHTCGGAWQFGNHVFHCDERHGTLNMQGAIATSCDIFFYQTALAVGPDKIAEVARRFGLGQVFDIGVSGQKAGIVPDREWKKRYFKNSPDNQKWFPGETPSMGIGQGYTTVNPLQLCVMVSRIANGKKSLHPRLVKSIGGVPQPSGAEAEDLPVDKDHLQFVRNAMAAVTTGTGTAARVADLGLGPIKMAGKTGTAQSHSYKGGRGAHGAVGEWALRDHAWFVAFAPYDDPRYAISVLVEHGGFGAQAAAPRAREIMRVALLKDPELRARIETPLPLPALPPDAGAEGAAPEPPTLLPGVPA